MASDSSRPANGNGAELLRKEIKPSVEFEIAGWDERKCIDILIVKQKSTTQTPGTR